jgi:MFS transporter, ACS family, tartrate transporter
LEERVLGKLRWRLMPLLCACFVAAFLDRVNVGFAKLTMLPDVGLTEQSYALGAGIFFIGYFFFEVPSNLILARIGARVWIARIMLVWGIISASMLLVQGPTSFYVLRFLLGAAEAGFFPGVIYYLTLWFPKAYRARAVSTFMLAAVVSLVLGGPLSGWLMDNPALGLKGWQWLFLVEALPSIALAPVVLFALPNGPQSAPWLDHSERAWLLGRLAEDQQAVSSAEAPPSAHDASAPGQPPAASLLQTAKQPRVWLLCGIYFLNVVGGYGLDFFAASLFRDAFPLVSKTELGLLMAVAPLLTIPVMLWYGRRCDARGAHSSYTAWAAIGFSLGLAALALPLSSGLLICAMTLCSASRWSLIGPFWGLATGLLARSASAGAIALINSVGNLGGQAGPLILGQLVTASGSYWRGLAVLSALLLVGAVLALILRGSHRARSVATTA